MAVLEQTLKKHESSLFTILIMRVNGYANFCKLNPNANIMKMFPQTVSLPRAEPLGPLSQNCETLPTNELPAAPADTATLSLPVNKACRSKTLKALSLCVCASHLPVNQIKITLPHPVSALPASLYQPFHSIPFHFIHSPPVTLTCFFAFFPPRCN